MSFLIAVNPLIGVVRLVRSSPTRKKERERRGDGKKRRSKGHMSLLIAVNPLIGGVRLVRSAIPTREREREKERERLGILTTQLGKFKSYSH